MSQASKGEGGGRGKGVTPWKRGHVTSARGRGGRWGGSRKGIGGLHRERKRRREE